MIPDGIQVFRGDGESDDNFHPFFDSDTVVLTVTEIWTDMSVTVMDSEKGFQKVAASLAVNLKMPSKGDRVLIEKELDGEYRWIRNLNDGP